MVVRIGGGRAYRIALLTTTSHAKSKKFHHKGSNRGLGACKAVSIATALYARIEESAVEV
jgi:hypothetical protein